MAVLKSIDTDGSGVVNYTGNYLFFFIFIEFLAATIEKSVYMK